MGENRKRRDRRRRHYRRRGAEFLVLVLLLLAASALALLTEPEIRSGLKNEAARWSGHTAQQADQERTDGAKEDAFGLKVHYLDVEKCNCVLAESSDGHFMLIDAGSNDQAHVEKIISCLKERRVKKLDYLLITHPHRDHIYAVPEIINRFEVDEVLMGEFEVETVGTKTFQRVSDALEAKDLLLTRPAPGETYELGNASFLILANDDSEETAAEELNDCSIGLMLMDGFHRFLFYGDGEKKTEKKLLERGLDLKCDVLMAAHHGSNSSTKKEILKAAQPEIAVISCGIDGDGEVQEPSKKVLKRLQEAGTAVYRTDEFGNVTVTSSAEGLFVQTEK